MFKNTFINLDKKMIPLLFNDALVLSFIATSCFLINGTLPTLTLVPHF